MQPLLVDSDSWRSLWFNSSEDRTHWATLGTLTNGEMNLIAPYFQYHPEAVWVNVKRSFAGGGTSTGYCPDGRWCTRADCRFYHSSVDDSDYESHCMDTENFTYYSLQLGLGLVNSDTLPKELGFQAGRECFTEEELHISLARGPLVSSSVANAQRRGLNKVMRLLLDATTPGSPLGKHAQLQQDVHGQTLGRGAP